MRTDGGYKSYETTVRGGGRAPDSHVPPERGRLKRLGSVGHSVQATAGSAVADTDH